MKARGRSVHCGRRLRPYVSFFKSARGDSRPSSAPPEPPHTDTAVPFRAPVAHHICSSPAPAERGELSRNSRNSRERVLSFRSETPVSELGGLALPLVWAHFGDFAKSV